MDFFVVTLSNCISILAIIVSVSSVFYNIYANFPRLQISANVEMLTEFEADSDGIVYPSQGDTILWITITNHSLRRVFVTNLASYWSWNLLIPFQWKKIALDELFRIDQEKNEPVSRFWVEPLGDVVLGTKIEDFEYKLQEQFTSTWDRYFHFALCYRVVVFDGQQKRYHSNKIKIINPSIRHKSFWQILKIIFSRKK